MNEIIPSITAAIGISTKLIDTVRKLLHKIAKHRNQVGVKATTAAKLVTLVGSGSEFRVTTPECGEHSAATDADCPLRA